MVGRPGAIVITDNGGTWTAGTVQVVINLSTYYGNFDTDKDTSMTALAAQIAAHTDVLSAVYNSTAHTITVTPKVQKQLSCVLTLGTLTGTMTWDYITENIYPAWASHVDSEIVQPSSGESIVGFVHGTRPPAHWFNFLFNMVYQLVNYLEYALGMCDEGQCVVDVYNNSPAKDITLTWRRRGKNIQLIFPDTTGISQGGGQFLLGYAKHLPIHLMPGDVQATYGLRVIDSSAGVHYCMVNITANGRIEIYMDTASTWSVVTPAGISQNVISYYLP